MAVRKNATKKTKNAELNLDLSEIKVKKKTKNKVKSLAKTGKKVWAIALVCLLFGIGLGVGAWWIVCKDDCFELVGNSELVLTLDQTYTDEGVKIVAFGKDESASIVIDTNLQATNNTYSAEEVGTYYIKYTSTCLKYGKIFKIEKVRLVSFVEISEGGE